MLHLTRPTVKLEKSLLRLKQNFLSRKNLFTRYVLPSYFIKPSGGVRLKNNGFKTLVNEHSSNVNCNGNKHIFAQTVDYKKLFVNASNPFTVVQVMSFINKAHVKKICKIHTFTSNFTTNISNNVPVITRKYCTSTCSPPSCVGRHCYHEETENAINHQILVELNASYAYLSMACFFGRTEVALPGCYGYFMKMHDEEHEHALIFINYQLMRGGHVKLCPLTIPECQNWEGIQKAFAVAVEMEKLVKEKLTVLYSIAEKHRDLHVMDLVTTKFLEEQERSICEISRLFMRATHMGCSGMADYLFDKEVHRAFVKKSCKNKDKMEDEENKCNLYV